MDDETLGGARPVDIEEKVVFAVANGPERDSLALLIGIPEGAWTYMKDGKTHHFDLNRIGVPIKVLVFGASTHAEAMRVIVEHNKQMGFTEPTVDLRRDFGIKPTNDA